jgi:hypothetical protein
MIFPATCFLVYLGIRAVPLPRSTNVWQYTDGNWMMIPRQATIYDPDVKHY